MQYKPIIKNDDINLNNLFQYLLLRNNKIIRLCIFSLLLYTIYFFVSTPKFTSSVSFYTNYNSESSPTQNFLSSFGSDFISETDLQFSVQNYIQSDTFLNEIVETSFIVDKNKITLTDLWGIHYNKYLSLNPLATLMLLNRNISFGKNIGEDEKKRFHAKTLLLKNMTLNEDNESSLSTLSLTVKRYPDLSKQIIESAYKSIINFSYQITKIKSEEKISFIKAQFKDIEKSLNNAENDMIEFLESNNSIQSPALIVKKNRLETEISLFSQLYISLNDQLELAKIEEQDITSSIYLLDSPTIYPLKSGYSLFKGYIVLGIITYVFSMLFFIYKDRKEIILIN